MKRTLPWYHQWLRGADRCQSWLAAQPSMAAAWAAEDAPIEWLFASLDHAAEHRGVMGQPPIEHPDRVVALAVALADAAQEFVPAGEHRPGEALALARLGPIQGIPWPQVHAAREARAALADAAHFAAHAAEVTLDLASGGGPAPRAWKTVERIYWASLNAFKLAGRLAEGESTLGAIVRAHLPDPPTR